MSCHDAALPVPYRITPEQPTFQSLKDPACLCLPEGRPLPVALDPFTCNRYEITEALGRRPPASLHSPDMSRHSYFGTEPKIMARNREYAARL